MTLQVSAVLPAHNPHAERLRRALAALRSQTVPVAHWETILVDNASTPALTTAAFGDIAPPNLRIVSEPSLGLTSARRRGLKEARAALVVFVDDDNILASDYLAHVIRLFAAQPQLGAAGGKSLPEFERVPPAWAEEFFPLLALRDPGPNPAIAQSLSSTGGACNQYPAAAAPIGAGMALRREAANAWLANSTRGSLSDRRGRELSSGGDNDIVLTVLKHGWHVGYFPELSLTHVIPATRLDPVYLARLNRGIQKSWMEVLRKHAANPWSPIASWTVPLRQLKAWFTHRAWSGPAARIRWQGACGHFEGRCSHA